MKILGQDDWLIYARRDDGELVFTVIETDPHWLNTPNQGEAQHGSLAWRVDNSAMQLHVAQHEGEYSWQPCDTDTDGTYLGWPESEDAAFIQRSRRTYLCD